MLESVTSNILAGDGNDTLALMVFLLAQSQWQRWW